MEAIAHSLPSQKSRRLRQALKQEMAARQVQLDGISFANDRPFVLLGGVNVLEDLDFTLRCAGHYKQVCERLGIPLVFKASYDKANRSSIHSFRGPGLDEGLTNPAGRQGPARHPGDHRRAQS